MTNIIKDICSSNVNDGFKFVPSDNSLPNVTFNGTKVFNHNLKGIRNVAINDLFHFDKVSMIEFGKRYFYKYNNDLLLDLSSVTTGGKKKKRITKKKRSKTL
jgi:hypothetical protein